ncbi:beta-1,3-glucosyltransferase-like [Ornithodoros turicata]|uniref:beta-1,3-glucosyltransferase-like n=1 Tax=Ornithodoros turicata TaxID=34597 RepID=UPI00313885B7
MSVHIRTLSVFYYLLCLPLTWASASQGIALLSTQRIDIVFVILSEDSSYHRQTAERLSDNLRRQSDVLNKARPTVYSVAHDFVHIPGAWAILPILSSLAAKHKNPSTWFFFCEDSTGVDLGRLHKLLRPYNSSEEHFLGYQLRDVEPTIIHHFDESRSLAYPDMAAGFIISLATIKKASKAWSNASVNDFVIDRQYEFAKFLLEACNGPCLQHPSEMCLLEKQGSCASWAKMQAPSCDGRERLDQVVFAVKTCTKFHEERVSVVKRTWHRDASTVLFFSDSRNDSIPTIDLGIRNTEKGHCTKTMKILDYIASDEKYSTKKWLLLADDDTLLSVPRLLNFLSCFSSDETMVVGERYGFGVLSGHGYNYPTGGSGIVFSMAAVRALVKAQCTCPSNDSPDDMMLGICLQELGIPIVHSPLFHQARPVDYSADLLAHQQPISFHKYWMLDPIEAYERWLKDVDVKGHVHDEH